MEGREPTAADKISESTGATDAATAINEAGSARWERIVGELKSGAIDVETALDQIVNALVQDTTMKTGVSVEGREELAGLMRSALREDPTLVAMVKDIISDLSR